MLVLSYEVNIWDKGTSGNRTSWGRFDYRLIQVYEIQRMYHCAHKGIASWRYRGVVKKDTEGSYSILLEDQEYFMKLAQDHWIVAPESASRIGHPRRSQ